MKFNNGDRDYCILKYACYVGNDEEKQKKCKYYRNQNIIDDRCRYLDYDPCNDIDYFTCTNKELVLNSLSTEIQETLHNFIEDYESKADDLIALLYDKNIKNKGVNNEHN